MGKGWDDRLLPHGGVEPQHVLNESWPFHDARGNGHAHGIDDRPGIDVTVRVVWETDGEEWLDGHAVRWHRQHVCVSVADNRSLTPVVWVRAGDVRRR